MSIRRNLFTWVTVLALLAMVFGAAMVSVSAAPVDSASLSATSTVHTAPTEDVGGGDVDGFTRNSYLPMNRWATSTASLHNQFDSFVASNLTEKMFRGTLQSMGLLGSSAYIFSSGEFLRFAVNFDVLGNQMGAAVDSAVGDVGSALVNDPLLLGGVFGSIVIFILYRAVRRSSRGEGAGMVKQLVGAMAVLAVIVTMTGAAIGAADRVTTDSDGVVHYSPNIGSPVWSMTVLSDTVSNFAAAPAAAMVNWSPALVEGEGSYEPYSCDRYTRYLNGKSDAVSRSMSSGWAATEASNVVAITQIMNSLWTKTALEAWKNVQFGSNNPYADYMYCRGMEMQAAPATVAASATVGSMGQSGGGAPAGINMPNSPVFNPNTSGDVDATLIGWAACRPSANPSGPGSFTIAPGWSAKKDGSTWIDRNDCWQWWSASDSNGIPGDFRIHGQPQDIRALTDNPQVLNFVDNLHGTNMAEAAQGVMTTFSVLVAGLGITLVFGGLSLLVVLSKIFMLMLVLMLFFILIVSMFSRKPSERLAPTLQKLIGVTLYSFSLSITVSFIAIITIMLMNLGTSVFGSGNPLNFIWAGIAPVGAAIILHLLFKKGFKIPSPMTRTGAVAWGAAGGAAGGAIGAGIANGFARRAKSAVSSVARRGAGGLMNRATDGMLNKAGRGGFGKAAKHGMDGGVRRTEQGENDQTAMGAAAAATTPMSPKAQYQQLAREARAEAKVDRGPGLGAKLGGAARATGGRVLAGGAVGAQMLSRDPQKRAAAVQTARESLASGRATVQKAATAKAEAVRRGVQNVGQEARSAVGTAGYLAKSLRENPDATRQFISDKAQSAKTAAVNTAKQNAKPLAKAGVVAGAVVLGPVTSVPMAGYLAYKGGTALRDRHVQKKQDKHDEVMRYADRKRAAERRATERAEFPAAAVAPKAESNTKETEQ